MITTNTRMVRILEQAADSYAFCNYSITILIIDSKTHTGVLRWHHNNEWAEISIYANHLSSKYKDNFEWQKETKLQVEADIQEWVDSLDKNRE